jgi:hypothetical protein
LGRADGSGEVSMLDLAPDDLITTEPEPDER